MPPTVRAKLLLGWMSQHEALEALKSCHFDEHLSDKKAIALWKHYRNKVAALEPRNVVAAPELVLTEAEQAATKEHIRRIHAGPNAQFAPRVIKISPRDLLAKQFHVLTDRSEQYAEEMKSEGTRISHCLGDGLQFKGQLVFSQITPRRIHVDLPHPEYTVIPTLVNGQPHFEIKERDRYIMAIQAPNGRMVLWGGYHRTHALLCHMAGEAEAVAPLLTVMTGIPEVINFFARPSFVREAILCDRPALFRDFLDEELFMVVNLRKRRARARIEQKGAGKFRWYIDLVNDDS
jgi:hypothetical protein